MSPGGKVLQDVGADSEDGQQAEQRQQPLLSLFSPSSSASGGLSIPGGPGLDHLPPSERYNSPQMHHHLPATDMAADTAANARTSQAHYTMRQLSCGWLLCSR